MSLLMDVQSVSDSRVICYPIRNLELLVGEVQIVFVGGKFSSAKLPLTKRWTREEWKLLAQVEKTITLLEYQISQEAQQ